MFAPKSMLHSHESLTLSTNMSLGLKANVSRAPEQTPLPMTETIGQFV